MTLTRKAKQVRKKELGRRTVDYFELAAVLEEEQKRNGYLTFSEFARQIARDWLKRNSEQEV